MAGAPRKVGSTLLAAKPAGAAPPGRFMVRVSSMSCTGRGCRRENRRAHAVRAVRVGARSRITSGEAALARGFRGSVKTVASERSVLVLHARCEHIVGRGLIALGEDEPDTDFRLRVAPTSHSFNRWPSVRVTFVVRFSWWQPVEGTATVCLVSSGIRIILTHPQCAAPQLARSKITSAATGPRTGECFHTNRFPSVRPNGVRISSSRPELVGGVASKDSTPPRVRAEVSWKSDRSSHILDVGWARAPARCAARSW